MEGEGSLPVGVDHADSGVQKGHWAFLGDDQEFQGSLFRLAGPLLKNQPQIREYGLPLWGSADVHLGPDLARKGKYLAQLGEGRPLKSFVFRRRYAGRDIATIPGGFVRLRRTLGSPALGL
jgi:hypothetical protein